MQLRSTTPIYLCVTIIRWLAMILIPVAVIFMVFVQTTNAQTNNDRQQQIDEISAEIDKRVESTRALNKQSNTVSSQLTALKQERTYLKAQITKNLHDRSSLKLKIADTKQALDRRQSALGTIMANMYVDDKISPLEMLASSNSVADFLDNQSQQTFVKNQLLNSIVAVQSVKKQLLVQQEEMVQIAGDQTNQSIALEKQQTDQQNVLAVVQGQTGKLSKVTAKMAANRKRLQNQQQQSMSALMQGATQVSPGTISQPVIQEPAPVPVQKKPKLTKPSSPKPAKDEPSTPTKPQPSKPKPTPLKPRPPVVLPNGGYPNYLNNCYVDSNALSYGIDPWGYGCRQCVSYTAWKVLEKTGRSAMYWGNAKDWPTSARRVGYKTSSTPRAKSVGVMTSGPYGHVVWVESVNSNGTLNISQYNYWLPNKSNGGWGWYSEFKNVSPRTYQVYIYV